MKILQLVDSLSIGGAERMAVNIACKLTELGYENTLVVARKTGHVQLRIPEGVKVHYLGKTSFFDLKAFSKLVKWAKSENPDLIHAHSSSVVWAVLLKFFLPGKTKVIFHDHFGKAESLKDGDRKWLKTISGRIDGVIAVNDKLLQWNRDNLKLEPIRVVQLDNFPFLHLQKEDRPHRDEVRLLHLANFRPQKDHFNLLEALSKLQQRVPGGWHVSLVGLASDETYFHSIREKIKALGLEQKIDHIGATDRVEDFLRNADVGVLSSESEGLSVSLLEYGIAGLQVVATDVGQTKLVLKDPKMGSVVPAKDAEALSLALEEAIQRAKTGRNSAFQTYVEDRFGATSFIGKYFDFINQLS